MTRLLCVQLTRSVVTQFVMSRYDFFAFVLKPLSRPRSCVATLFLSVQLISVLSLLCRDLDPCRDIDLSP